ncbi:hypothetical protein T492DRAFT_926441, partial [Pavlovales sp. CCMP2436]
MAAQARIVLLLCACSLALGSSIRPRGGPRPDYRTRRGPPPAVSNAPANSVPRVEFEDEHIALVYKPAGVALDAGPDSARFSRGGPPLGAWAARALLASNERDSLAPRCELFTTLGPEVGGLALFAKTGRCAAILEREVQATECYKMTTNKKEGVGTPIILRTSEAPPRAGDGGGPRALSLVRVSAMGNVGAERVAARLAELGLPVAGGQGARGFDGGIHLALASVILPPALAALRGEDATTTFRIEPPAKFMKTLRREALHAARHAAAAADAEAIATGSISAEASVDTRVDFLGVSLLVGRTQLTPRSSSESTAALYAGDDGCEAYRQIAASLGACSPPLLAPGGAIAMQLPANGRAVRAVQAIFKAEGFAVSSIAKDERGIDRCILLELAPEPEPEPVQMRFPDRRGPGGGGGGDRYDDRRRIDDRRRS